MARMRSIEGAYKEIHEKDPNSAVSKRYIRQLVTSGVIPARKAGKKYLLNFDMLESYLSGDEAEQGDNRDTLNLEGVS